MPLGNKRGAQIRRFIRDPRSDIDIIRIVEQCDVREQRAVFEGFDCRAAAEFAAPVESFCAAAHEDVKQRESAPRRAAGVRAVHDHGAGLSELSVNPGDH